MNVPCNSIARGSIAYMNGHLENSRSGSNSPGKLERIKQAALLFGDEIYTGNNHIEALKALRSAHPHVKFGELQDGFVTDTNRFVNRIDAGKIAVRAEQIDSVGALQSEDISKIGSEKIA